MAAGARIVWARHPNTIAANLGKLAITVQARLTDRLARRAFQVEAKAKVRAPWTDRTGAARNGLRGTSEVTHNRAELVLSHAVDYGIWLELAHRGAWGVVIPVMQEALADVKADLRELL